LCWGSHRLLEHKQCLCVCVCVQRCDGTAQRLVLWQFNLIFSLSAWSVISFIVSFLIVLNKSFVFVFFKQKSSDFLLRKNSNRRTVLSYYTIFLMRHIQCMKGCLGKGQQIVDTQKKKLILANSKYCFYKGNPLDTELA